MGNPVQSSPKANFWTKGPRIRPPTIKRPVAQRANFRGLLLGSSAAIPARVEKSMARNMMRMWGIRITAGTGPLKRIITGFSPDNEISFPWDDNITLYSNFPAGGCLGMLATNESSLLTKGILVQGSSVLCLL
ncbi:hypothetical protein ES703_112713 [subsurface metagenome]